VFLAPAPGEPVAEEAAARLGAEPALADPIIQAALRDRAVVGFESPLAAVRAGGAVVLAAPLEDVEGRLWGVLAVTDLPLAAHDAGTPARFAALAGHVADRLAFSAPGRLAAERREEDAQSFARSVRRAVLDHRQHGLASGVVQFAVEGKRAAELAEAIARQRRVTDRVLRAGGGEGRTTVTLLLPMTDDIGRARYLGRVEGMVRDLTGTTMAEAGVRLLEHAAVSDLDRMGTLELPEPIAGGARS
jgi:hypothetical protein